MVDMGRRIQEGVRGVWKKRENKMKILLISTIFGFGHMSDFVFFVYGPSHLLTHHFLCHLSFVFHVTKDHVRLYLSQIHFF